MNDNPQWQSPNASAAGDRGRSAGPTPPAGGPVAPNAQQPNAQQPPGGWTPPPKPGLIPLRPLDLGAILGAAFKTLRQNPKATLGTALLLQGGVTILAAAVVGVVTFFTLSRVGDAVRADQQDIIAGSIGIILISSLVPIMLSLAASALLQGIIVLNVMRAALGEKPKLRTLLRMAHGRIWALIGWTMLVAAAVVVAFGVLIGIIILLAAIGGLAGVLGAVLVGIFGVAALVVLWVWLSTKLSLVPSVLMAERRGLGASMKRSWALTNRAFWRTFGIQLLVSAIINIALQVVVTPITLVAGMLIGLADPNAQNAATAIAGAVISYAVLMVVTVVFGAIGAVIQSATVALIYIDLRMRKEGLDLDLARFVEARHSGAAEPGDPYRHDPSASTPPSSADAAAQSPWT